MVPTYTGHLPKTPSIDRMHTDDQCTSGVEPSGTKKERMQGEGNYEAAREFNDAERKLEDAARAAKPRSEAEQQEMIAAEQEGKRRAKDKDPALAKSSPESAPPGAPAKNAGKKHG